MKMLALLISIFFLSSSFAVDCSPVNLITEPGSPFSKIPVYDQKDSNICYAFAAAQMVDYYLIKNGAEKRSIHPAWLALNYALARKRDGLNIGHTKDSIESLSEVNNCDYDRVSSALTSWADTPDMSESGIIAFIEKFAMANRSPASSHRLMKKFEELKRMAISPVKVVEKILMSGCEDRSRVVLPAVQKYNYSQLPEDKDFEKFLIQNIHKNSVPYSIAYCSKVWKDPTYDGIELTFFGKRDSLRKDCEYHESIIVGRKPSGSSCNLLVRNTWGTEWRSGNKKWKCLCREKSTGTWIDDCDSSTHPDELYSVEACWIPSDKIARNVGVITVMETP